MVICPYAQNNLYADEKILIQTTLHWIIFIQPLFVMAIGLTVTFIFGSPSLNLTTYNPVNFITSNLSSLFALPSLVGFLLSLYGLFGVLKCGFYILSTEATVTNYRFIWKTGIIMRKTFEINISTIEGANLNQGFIGRILGYAHVNVRGPGVEDKVIPYTYNPVDIKDMIMHKQRRDAAFAYLEETGS